MKLLALVLVCFTSLLPWQRALADNRDFKLLNNTSWTIDSVYVSSSDAKGWGDDLLGASSLDAGQNMSVTWSGFLSLNCYYDVRVVFSGTPRVDIHWDRVNVCGFYTMRVWYDFSRKNYQATWE